MTRTQIINSLIKRFNYQSYLEIGVQGGVNFNQINCKYKVGVDPDPQSKATVHLTSDEFFKNDVKTFDIIFIDGLHEAAQVYKDIVNSLAVLSEGGTIVCHDMNPQTEIAQRVPREVKVWNGDCWRAFAYLKKLRFDLTMFVIDTDHGIGIIRKKFLSPLIDTTILDQLAIACDRAFEDPIMKLSYQDFDRDRKNLLNLISVEDFKLVV